MTTSGSDASDASDGGDSGDSGDDDGSGGGNGEGSRVTLSPSLLFLAILLSSFFVAYTLRASSTPRSYYSR